MENDMLLVPSNHVSFHKFHPLMKVDSTNHTVTGIITSESPDKVGEICDYESSKPYYQEWSDEIARATQGKSLGNVREMHGLTAVGKLIDLDYDAHWQHIQRAGKRSDDTMTVTR